MNKDREISTGLKAAFKELNKMNEDASILDDNALSVVKEYVDTGSMALNAIVSGSLYGGFPKGRITGLIGPMQSGKTHILCKAIANEQKKDPNVWGIIWDSENCYDVNTIKNVGGDPNRIKVCPVESVEDCRNQISGFLDKIIEDPSLNGKIIIGIDSLGNLASAKEIADSRNGKDAVDMGMRAKALKSMLRTLTYRAAKSNTTILFCNHVYDNPASLYPSLVKSQAGGSGPLYLASVLVQFATSHIKEDESSSGEKIPFANKVSGTMLSAMTVKNRFVPPFLKTSLELNYKTGLYKYSGLLDMAMGYGIITKDGNTYMLPDGTKLGFEKKFRDDVEMWETKVIPALDKKLQEELKFSSEDVKNIKNEVEELAEAE